ncbi:uncharacterized protein DS421_17g597980 [Arachis hypogaea]|nr:uncharacterized protein DS421_17g597980 [Arachis hypogaea]
MVGKKQIDIRRRRHLIGIGSEKAQGIFAKAEAMLVPSHKPNWEVPPDNQSTTFWIAPQPGRYKLNVDAAIVNEYRSSAGAIIRDEDGVCIGAATLEIDSSLSIREAEAMTLHKEIILVL